MRVARISYDTVMENIKHSEDWLTVSNFPHKEGNKGSDTNLKYVPHL